MNHDVDQKRCLTPFFTVLAIWVTSVIPSSLPGQSANVSARPATTMIYEGFTEPRHDIMVAATEIGRLDSVTVELGDLVQAGQVIGHLEDELQASSVKIARLQSEMTGELNAAQAEVDLHQSRTQSLRQLAADGMARPDELVRAETDLRIAAGRLAAAQEQLGLRKLELERYELQFQRRKIRVPMAGVISQVFHKPGEYITPGDPAVVRLLVMDKLFAVFNIPVEDTATIQVGSPVRVYLRSSARTMRQPSRRSRPTSMVKVERFRSESNCKTPTGVCSQAIAARSAWCPKRKQTRRECLQERQADWGQPSDEL